MATKDHEHSIALNVAKLVLGVVLACVAVTVRSEVVDAAPTEPSVVVSGRIAAKEWLVAAARDEKRDGICLGVRVSSLNGIAESERVQCSLPSPRRGIVLVTSDEPGRGQSPTMSALAAAFSPLVAKVRFETTDGGQKTVRLRPLPKFANTWIGKYHYVGFAVSGKLCLRGIRTYDRDGQLLWRPGVGELAVLGLNPGCR